jgi:2-keto-4-pentenoate hydratase/2-oxohepta-3-ene-1,7-dioic acid hydratase in catechol pathway
VHPDLRPSKIVCVGRNYLAHAAELGHDLPAEPLVFLKAPSALVPGGAPIRIPEISERVDFEGEIAFVVGRQARSVGPSEAWACLSHVVPFNDVTARDLQRTDDQWTRAKGFDTFAPAGTPVPLEVLRERGLDPAELSVETRVNGELRQAGDMRDMAFPVPVLVAWISEVMTLEPGDLLVTGTPEGVGRLVAGDRVRVEIPGVGAVENPVERAGPVRVSDD